MRAKRLWQIKESTINQIDGVIHRGEKTWQNKVWLSGLLECENSRARKVKRLWQNEVAFSWCENILTALHRGKFTEVKRLWQNKVASGLPFSVRILAARTLW